MAVPALGPSGSSQLQLYWKTFSQQLEGINTMCYHYCLLLFFFFINCFLFLQIMLSGNWLVSMVRSAVQTTSSYAMDSKLYKSLELINKPLNLDWKQLTILDP